MFLIKKINNDNLFQVVDQKAIVRKTPAKELIVHFLYNTLLPS